MKANAHMLPISPGTIAAIVQKIDELQTFIEPFVTPLTPTERHDLPKMGPKTLEFVKKCCEFAEANPALCPKFLNVDEFAIDYKDAEGLYLSVNKAAQLVEGLADTQLCAGSEAYQSALVFYHAVKTAAASDIAGAKAVYEELKKRFPQRPRRRSPDGETGA